MTEDTHSGTCGHCGKPVLVGFNTCSACGATYRSKHTTAEAVLLAIVGTVLGTGFGLWVSTLFFKYNDDWMPYAKGIALLSFVVSLSLMVVIFRRMNKPAWYRTV